MATDTRWYTIEQNPIFGSFEVSFYFSEYDREVLEKVGGFKTYDSAHEFATTRARENAGNEPG